MAIAATGGVRLPRSPKVPTLGEQGHAFDSVGWFGVFAVGIAVVIALRRVGVAAWRGDLFSATLLSALCGFMLVGLFDSLFDAPRLTTLFFLLLFLALRRV